MTPDIESLRTRTASVFSRYSIPAPLNVEIRPRSISLTKPRLSSDGERIIFLRMKKMEDYDAQIGWVVSNYLANNHENLFVRKAGLLEILLGVLFVIDGFFLVVLPNIVERIPGLLLYIPLQFLCLSFAFKIWKGKGQRGRIIGDTMMKTENWSNERANQHIEYNEGFYYTIPLVDMVFVTVVAWLLFFL